MKIANQVKFREPGKTSLTGEKVSTLSLRGVKRRSNLVTYPGIASAKRYFAMTLPPVIEVLPFFSKKCLSSAFKR